MNRQQKADMVAELREELQSVPSLIVATSVGVDANTMNALRAKLRTAGAKYRIIKNTLATLALKDTPLENITDKFVGETAVVYHPEDAVAAAKVFTEFAEKNDKIVARAAWLAGNVLDASGVVALSKMPGKDELRAQLLSVMTQVPTSFVRVLAAGPSSFLNVLNARKGAIEEGA